MLLSTACLEVPRCIAVIAALCRDDAVSGPSKLMLNAMPPLRRSAEMGACSLQLGPSAGGDTIHTAAGRCVLSTSEVLAGARSSGSPADVGGTGAATAPSRGIASAGA
eukprot:CAMPEP_0195595148 /NCGR_PEP_ID=MMETSP0815-20121206/1787_1 /TAXON_ID=97485 /ORGANISM="Prymnesium parvum, Strain Texoma1" /LENGTH=107 /DNA_ID=CAMNT_0040734383 /DNA_START=488 /DNA_END=807 /DNA_ORIENTATION=-